MKKMRFPIYRIITAVCLVLVTVLLIGCQQIIPETQKHNYSDPPYTDYCFSGIPEFVDDISLCLDPEKQYVLPDGYLYSCQSIPIYTVTNQLSIATNETGDVFNECGYQDNVRIRGIMEIGESDFSFVTGFIPIKKGDTVYFNRYCFDPGHQSAAAMNIVFYNTEKQRVTSTAMKTSLENAFEVVETDADGHITALKVRDTLTGSDIAYVRFTLIDSGKDLIIGVNEAFVPSGYEYGWARLGRYIPEDWYKEIKATVDAVDSIELKDENEVISFLFASDIHLDPYSKSSYTEHLGKVSAAVMNKCDIPFFVTGGDNCTQSSGFMPSDFAPNMKDLLAQLSPIPQKNILLSVGNHDGATGMAYNQYGEKVYYCFQLNNQERSSVFFDWQRETNENKKFDSDGTYYYMDDASTRTRYIILNSFWSQWQGNDEGYVYNVEHNFFKSHRFGPVQLHWFAEEALDMPPDYSAIIVAHFAPAAKDFAIFKGVVDAFTAQTTYSGEYIGAEDWQAVNMTVNYENANGEIIAIFQGHNHTNALYDYFETVPCINITTAGAYWAVRDENAVERVKGTSTEFAVDVVTIDRAARKIYLTRLGAGEDRVIDY